MGAAHSSNSEAEGNRCFKALLGRGAKLSFNPPTINNLNPHVIVLIVCLDIINTLTTLFINQSVNIYNILN